MHGEPQQGTDSEILNRDGIELQQKQRPLDALALFSRALTLKPDYVDALCNRGAALQALRRFDEALADYDRALALDAGHFLSLNNRGTVLFLTGRYTEAIATFDAAIRIQPDSVSLYYNRGLAAQQLGAGEAALADYARTLSLQPDHLGALNNRSAILKSLGRYPEALEALDRLLAVAPSNSDGVYNRGLVLEALGRDDDAMACFDRAIELRPTWASPYTNKGALLLRQARFGEALTYSERALALVPHDLASLKNRAHALAGLQKPDDAFVAYDRACDLYPDDADAFFSRAATLAKAGRYRDALDDYGRAATLDPNLAEAHFNEALIRLLLGDYTAGWEKYEWRWQTKHGLRLPEIPQIRWTGQSDAREKTLLVYHEQGFGDALQVARFLPLVRRQVGRLVVEVRAPLKPVFAEIPEIDEVVVRGEALPAFDVYSPLMSVPRVLGVTVDAIPGEPYLRASAQKIAAWRDRLGSVRRPRVGLVWAGSPTNLEGKTRSLRLEALSPLLALQTIEFISLQKELRDGDREFIAARDDLRHFGDALDDFADTAAILAQLDLVITIDTAVAHLAGALGRPTWVLLEHDPAWQWMLDREDSPWYPTARLFRQSSRGDWAGVIQTVRDRLAGQFAGGSLSGV